MSKTKTPLSEWPIDFLLTPRLSQFAKDAGLDPDVEWEAFHDSALANGRRYADWRAAFRTWCRNAAKWKAEKPNGNGRPIGFRAPVAQPEVVSQARLDNEAARLERESLTPEQVQANIRRFGDMIKGIKSKGLW